MGDPLEYTCGCCGGTFKSDWSMEDAEKEKAELFPAVPRDQCGIVCDDCFQRIMSSDQHSALVN